MQVEFYVKTNYSQIDKEGASIVFVSKKNYQHLLGNRFSLTIDNEATKNVLDSKTDLSRISAVQLVQWSLILAQNDYDVEIKSTKEDGFADILSRLPRVVKGNFP